MINEVIFMNGYALYVWSAFIFTFLSFLILYKVTKSQLVKENLKFEEKFKSLDLQRIIAAKKQKTYREILVYTSITKI